MEEMQRYLGVLRQLKDFDENLAREIAARAYQEQEKMKLEVSFTGDVIPLKLNQSHHSIINHLNFVGLTYSVSGLKGWKKSFFFLGKQP